jgi:uncharacterized SAM-binding protein YcdF (DUF218 family)
MFELLTRILLWVLIFTILWYVFVQFIPRLYLTWLGGLLVAAFIILSFFDPTDRTVSVVWNLLSLPLQPLGLTIVLLLSSLRGGVNKAVGNVVLAALLVLVISSMPIVAYWLTNQTEQSVVNTISGLGDRPADPSLVSAIVVLGDPINPSNPSYRSTLGSAEAELSTGMTARLLQAADLYQEQADQGNSPLVIVSTGPQPSKDNIENTRAAREVLESQGVPSDRFLAESQGANVRGSALEVDELLRDRGFNDNDSIVLVASAVNIRRATSTFTQLGFDVIPRPTDLYGFQLQPEGRLLVLADLVPNVDALALTTRVVEEYLTSIYYFLRGWLVSPLAY